MMQLTVCTSGPQSVSTKALTAEGIDSITLPISNQNVGVLSTNLTSRSKAARFGYGRYITDVGAIAFNAAALLAGTKDECSRCTTRGNTRASMVARGCTAPGNALCR